MSEYKEKRLVDGKLKWVVTDEDGNVKNRNPSREELEGLERWDKPYKRNKKVYRYNEGNRCEFITEDNKRCPENLHPRNARNFIIDGKSIWYCEKHGNVYRKRLPNSTNNIIKYMRGSRTGSLNPDCGRSEGNITQRLVKELYDWEDLNAKYDNYETPVDFADKDGKLHQVQGRRYNPINRWWVFTHWDNEFNKEYEDMICICKSEDGKMVEEIYKFPPSVVKGQTGVSIFRYDAKGRPYKLGWYEQYRVKGVQREDELKKANDILKRILEEENKKKQNDI